MYKIKPNFVIENACHERKRRLNTGFLFHVDKCFIYIKAVIYLMFVNHVVIDFSLMYI